jgi:hypothetical protein
MWPMQTARFEQGTWRAKRKLLVRKRESCLSTGEFGKEAGRIEMAETNSSASECVEFEIVALKKLHARIDGWDQWIKWTKDQSSCTSAETAFWRSKSTSILSWRLTPTEWVIFQWHASFMRSNVFRPVFPSHVLNDSLDWWFRWSRPPYIHWTAIYINSHQFTSIH